MNVICYIERDKSIMRRKQRGVQEFQSCALFCGLWGEAVKNATCIMVAHRLNTIKKADIIYEIKDGTIIRYDSFEEFEKTRKSA